MKAILQKAAQVSCPVCRSVDSRQRYQFDWGKILQCGGCSCAFADGVDCESENQLAFSDGNNEEDFLLQRQWARERLSTLLRFINGGELLEFGPGTGEFLHTAATAGFTVVGVDRYPRVRPDNQHSRISVLQSDARTFRSWRPFDVVAALHVLEHFPDPYEFLESVHRNLSAGGMVLLEVPNYGSLSRAIAGHRWNCFVNYHALQFTPRSMETLLQKSGFKVVHLETVGCSTTQLLGLGLPSLGRRIGFPVRYGWEPAGVLRRMATNVENILRWGYNLRLVARKV